MRAVGITTALHRNVDSDVQLPPALHGGPYEEVDTAFGPLWVLSNDEVMRPYLIRHRAWKDSDSEFLASLIRAGTRFLDVGANIGYFSLFAARTAPDVTIHAVEPHPVLNALLRANLWANRVPARIWNAALGSERRILPLTSAPTSPDGTRIEGAITGACSLAVPVVAADELLRGTAFDVVKIDVHGWEPEIVAGMEQIVRMSPGIVLMIAFFPTALRARGLDPREVLECYRMLGYELSVQDHWGLGHCAVEDAVGQCDSAGKSGQVNLVLRRA